MTLNEILTNIENMIGLELEAIHSSAANIIIKSIDYNKKRFAFSTVQNNRLLYQDFKSLQTIIDELNRNGYCNVNKALNNSNDFHIETLFANIPRIQFLNIDRKKQLILRNEAQHSLGEVQEVPKKETKKIKSSIVSHSTFNYLLLSQNLNNVIRDIKYEVEKLHFEMPGFLVNTNLREVISELESIHKSVQTSVVTIDNNVEDSTVSVDENADEASLYARNKNFDMSDLVDLSSVTGISDDNTISTSYEDNDLDEDHTYASEIYVPSIRRQTPSLALIYERLNYEEIEIQPDYQRQDRIWTDDKKSKLIESILMGLPLPIFYFGERKNDNWVVIDGLQRLTTVQDFMQNKFSLKLNEESSVFEMNNKTFKDFDRKYTRILREFEITAYVIDIEEDEHTENANQFIVELFHRINTYGVKLSDQEIRSAINFGNSVYYLKFLASSNNFINATTNTVNPKRQKDLELCLSALSFIIFGYENLNNFKYDNFLSKTMKWINDRDFKKVETEHGHDYESESPVIITLTSNFESSLDFCKEIFGNDAFKKARNSGKKEPISKTLFEVLVTLFANIDEEQKDIIRCKKGEMVNLLYKSISNNSREYATWSSSYYQDINDRGLNYSLSTSTSKKVTILYRFESILNIIKASTGCDIKITPINKQVDEYDY